nr:hypothetical protein GCM10020092_052260 [Actinoplanes digitatis]
MGASQPEHLLLAANAVRSGFTEPGAKNDGAPDADGARVGEDARHLVSGHRDDQQVDRPGQLLDRAVAGDIVHVGTGAVDGVQVAGEVVVAQCEQGLPADAAWAVVGADHRDRGGREQGAQRGAFCGAVPAVDGELCRVVDVDVESDVDDAVVEPGPGVGGQASGDAQHPGIARQYFADQFFDAAPVGPIGQVFQQEGADAAVPLWLGDEECELGAAAGSLAGGDADEVVALECEDREVLVGFR